MFFPYFVLLTSVAHDKRGINIFTCLFDKYLLSVHLLPGTILSIGDIAVNDISALTE